MKLYLIDGYGLVFRAYHSLPPMHNKDGIPTSAIYGIVNMILKIKEDHKPDLLAVALDTGHKNHRHNLLPSYKANRTTPPEDLKQQFPFIREAIQALNITVLEANGYEADDLIASYAIKGLEYNLQTTIVSSDKDLMQLLSHDGITMYDPVKNKFITDEDVYLKFGVQPSCLLDALSLIGDASDNVAGVAGIGVKTAAKLINEYHSLDNIYLNIEHIQPERIKKALLQDKDQAFLARSLISLIADAPLQHTFQDMHVQAPIKQQIIDFAYRFSFKELPKKLFGHETLPSSPSSLIIAEHTEQKLLELVEVSKDFLDQDFFKKVNYDGYIAIHCTKEELMLATSQFNIVIPCSNNEALYNHNAQNDLLYTLRSVFESNSIKKIFCNAKPFLKLLRKLNIQIKSYDDISIMAYCVSTNRQYKNLQTLLGREDVNAFLMIATHQKLIDELVEAKTFSVYNNIEKPLLPILITMEENGVLVDGSALNSISLEFYSRIQDIAQKIYTIAEENFNIASTQQLGKILFEKLKLPYNAKRNKNGHYSTDFEILENLKEQDYEIAALLLEWRQLTKLLNTYTDALQKNIDHNTGRIHTTFENNSTNTGRLSSHDPNLQNIPVRTEEGKKIRQTFIAAKKHLILSADYSQIELRLLAEMADVKSLKQAFIDDLDIHTVTASEIFNIPLDSVDSNLRRKAKAINFGIIYGISAFGLAKNVGLTHSEAKQYIDSYFIKYPEIPIYMKNTITFAKQHGFVMTCFNRKCFIQGIQSNQYKIRNFAERAAINAPLQGSASDIIKKAMIQLPQELLQYLILQIHDELLFEIPECDIETLKPKIKSIMENSLKLSIPLKVDVKINHHW